MFHCPTAVVRDSFSRPWETPLKAPKANGRFAFLYVCGAHGVVTTIEGCFKFLLQQAVPKLNTPGKRVP